MKCFTFQDASNIFFGGALSVPCGCVLGPLGWLRENQWAAAGRSWVLGGVLLLLGQRQVGDIIRAWLYTRPPPISIKVTKAPLLRSRKLQSSRFVTPGEFKQAVILAIKSGDLRESNCGINLAQFWNQLFFWRAPGSDSRVLKIGV